MNYPRSQFSKSLNYFRLGIAIVKFMPLVPLMAQVEETQMYTCKFCKLAYNTIFP